VPVGHSTGNDKFNPRTPLWQDAELEFGSQIISPLLHAGQSPVIRSPAPIQDIGIYPDPIVGHLYLQSMRLKMEICSDDRSSTVAKSIHKCFFRDGVNILVGDWIQIRLDAAGDHL